MLDKLKVRVGIDKSDKSKDDLLLLLLEDAESQILDFTNRDTLPIKAENLQRELAVTFYNRLGSEGESSRSEGGVSVSYSTDIPEGIKGRLKAFKKLKAVGLANEDKKQKSILSKS
ncbi:MAG: phage head-tail connector protein [Clostridium sp.]|uniref:phage head-tail connector protein n=1 Tax=Clostridium sp. TaxID=1506 RepID=UPI003F2C8F85